MAKLRVRWVKSAAGRKFDQKRTIKAMGFRRLGQVVEHTDSPSLRGMIHKVEHLVEVEEPEN